MRCCGWRGWLATCKTWPPLTPPPCTCPGSRCDLADLAAAAADSLARRFDAAGIAVDRQLAAAPVLADPRWLHQVITNLLSNALKFTPPGGWVTISIRQNYPDAVLEVTDTGSGIPADELPHVFDRFWRGRQAAQTSGSGIGLSVAARPGPRARRPADRGQPARARHNHDAHPARRLTSGRHPSAVTRTRPLAAHPEDQMSLTISHRNQRLTVQVTLGELPGSSPLRQPRKTPPRSPSDRHSKGTGTPPPPACIRS